MDCTLHGVTYTQFPHQMLVKGQGEKDHDDHDSLQARCRPRPSPPRPRAVEGRSFAFDELATDSGSPRDVRDAVTCLHEEVTSTRSG